MSTKKEAERPTTEYDVKRELSKEENYIKLYSTLC
jgi:hypothetical protein